MKKLIAALFCASSSLAAAQVAASGTVIYSAPKEVVVKADLKNIRQASVRFCPVEHGDVTLPELFLRATNKEDRSRKRLILQAVSMVGAKSCRTYLFDYVEQDP